MTVSLFERGAAISRMVGNLVQPLVKKNKGTTTTPENSSKDKLLRFPNNSISSTHQELNLSSSIEESNFQDIPTVESFASKRKAYEGLIKFELEVKSLILLQNHFIKTQLPDFYVIYPESRIRASCSNRQKLNYLKIALEERVKVYRHKLITFRKIQPYEPKSGLGRNERVDMNDAFICKTLSDHEERLSEVELAIHRQSQLDFDLKPIKTTLLEQLGNESIEYEKTGTVSVFEEVKKPVLVPAKSVHLAPKNLLHRIGLVERQVYKKSRSDFLYLMQRKNYLKKEIRSFYTSQNIDKLNNFVKNYRIKVGDISYLSQVSNTLLEQGKHGSSLFKSLQCTISLLDELNGAVLPRLSYYKEDNTVLGRLRKWISPEKTSMLLNSDYIPKEIGLIESINHTSSPVLTKESITLQQFDNYTALSTLLYMKSGVNSSSYKTLLNRMTPDEECHENTTDITSITGLYNLALIINKHNKNTKRTGQEKGIQDELIANLQLKVTMGINNMFKNIFVNDIVFSELTPQIFDTLIQAANKNNLNDEEKVYLEELELINNRFKLLVKLSGISDDVI